MLMQSKSETKVRRTLTKKTGFNTRIVEEALAAGPAGLRRAQRTALRHAKRYLEKTADSWKLETKWLKSFDAT
jgi:hypothetical protein